MSNADKPEVVLPELPETEVRIENYIDGWPEPYYSAVQMRAYGQVCIDALHDKVLIFLHHLEDVMDEHPEVEGWIDHKLWDSTSLRSATRVDTLTRPTAGEYDRELIACMLQDFRRGRLGTYKTESVEEQMALLREADNRDAAGGGRTVNLSTAPKHIVQKVDEAERGLQTPRRVKAVELLLSLGYQWDGAQWTQPQQPAEAAAVDLERFREPVLFWQHHCYSALGLDSALRVRSEALDLLAIIDNAPPAIDNAPSAIDIGKLRELLARWRSDDADDAHSTSTWDQGFTHGKNECADELAAIIGYTEPEN